MKISTQTRYAMRFLLEVSLHESKSNKETKITTQEIAVRQGISKKYLESIATKLKKGGIILSSKGVNGGYMLAKSEDEISLGDIMRLMESTYFSIHCIETAEEDCPNYAECILAEFWKNLETSISNMVDSLKLKDIKNQTVFWEWIDEDKNLSTI